MKILAKLLTKGTTGVWGGSEHYFPLFSTFLFSKMNICLSYNLIKENLKRTE